MNQQELIRRQIHVAFHEIQYLIRLLYSTTDIQSKNLALNQLWNKVSLLHFLVNLMDDEKVSSVVTPTLPHPPAAAASVNPTMPTQGTLQNLPEITREQLARNNGRNGNPAYVAVNGIVYDVTNNAAWSAATHFGLAAGKDLTQEFASCHAGQQWILNTLKPVGRLV